MWMRETRVLSYRQEKEVYKLHGQLEVLIVSKRSLESLVCLVETLREEQKKKRKTKTAMNKCMHFNKDFRLLHYWCVQSKSSCWQMCTPDRWCSWTAGNGCIWIRQWQPSVQRWVEEDYRWSIVRFSYDCEDVNNVAITKRMSSYLKQIWKHHSPTRRSFPRNFGCKCENTFCEV